MSGILWPVSFLLGSRTTKARRLGVGQFVKGKNGYVRFTNTNVLSALVKTCANGMPRYIYKIVDLVNARDRTLITTYHDIMGQESFLVAPWELIETVREGTSSGPSGEVSPGSRSGSGEMSRSGSDGDDESIDTAFCSGNGGEDGEEDEEGMTMRISSRRRAATDQIDGGRSAGRGNFFTGGGNTRRLVSEVARRGPTYTERNRGPTGLDGANSREASPPGNKKLGDESILRTAVRENGEGGRNRSYSTASTESYRGLWGLLHGFRITQKQGDIITGESSGDSGDGKSSGGSNDSKSLAATLLDHAGVGETFVREWRVVEKRRARDEDDSTSSFDCRF